MINAYITVPTLPCGYGSIHRASSGGEWSLGRNKWLCGRSGKLWGMLRRCKSRFACGSVMAVGYTLRLPRHPIPTGFFLHKKLRMGFEWVWPYTRVHGLGCMCSLFIGIADYFSHSPYSQTSFGQYPQKRVKAYSALER
jgi:hypothetical protein